MLNVFANAMMVATRSTLMGSGPVRDKWLNPAARRQQSRRAVAAAIAGSRVDPVRTGPSDHA
jgi:hypothetical protein